MANEAKRVTQNSASSKLLLLLLFYLNYTLHYTVIKFTGKSEKERRTAVKKYFTKYQTVFPL